MRPAWERDVTDDLERVEAAGGVEAVGGVVAEGAKGEPIGVALSRERRMGMMPLPGQEFWWRARVSLPSEPGLTDGAGGGWPMVVEWDESRLVPEAFWNGRSVGRPRMMGNMSWSGGEGVCVLPAKAGETGVLTFRAGWLTQVYENGFGRVRVRPAEVDEVIEVARQDRAIGLSNRSAQAMPLTVRYWVSDFCGSPLVETAVSVKLEAGGSTSVKTPDEVIEKLYKPGGYKLRIALEAGSRRSREYWIYGSEHEIRTHEEVLTVLEGWEYLNVRGEFGPGSPGSGTEGWKKAQRAWDVGRRMTATVPESDWKTHRVWFRTTATVPAEWKSPRLRMHISRVMARGVVYVNGERVGELSQWETPGWLDLPATVKAGSKVEIAIGVTDFVVGLREGAPVLEDGKNDPPGDRALAGPINNVSPAIGYVEVVGVGEVNSQDVQIRTRGKTVSGKVALVSTDVGGKVRPVVTVLRRGEVLARAEGEVVTLEKGERRAIELKGVEVPSAVLWSPDSPELYEYRLELVSPDGRVLDRRRERFGFREFEVAGGGFRLNRETIHIWGNSHSMWDLERNLWPVMPTNNRFPRLYVGMTQHVRAADELGLLVKVEVNGHEAWHRDKYAYHEQVMWDRLDSQLRRVGWSMMNSPAMVMVDAGNELWFARSGEDQKMSDAFKRYREFDPTRYAVTSGGSPSLLPGAEIADWHGWPNEDSRRDWFFYHPEDRPKYLASSGVYAHVPAGEPREKWTVLDRGNAEAAGSVLSALDGRTVLFSEGHYYECRFAPSLNGASTWVPIPEYPINGDFDRMSATHDLSWLGYRKMTVQSARAAGFPGNLIHVDRGIGRWIQPLAAVSVDRKSRYRMGERLQTRLRVLHDLSAAHEVTTVVRLFDGAAQIGEQRLVARMAAGAFADMDVDLPIPVTAADRDYRLSIEVTAEGYAGYFRDDLTVTAMAVDKPALPAGVTLAVFDPAGGVGGGEVAGYLRERGVSFRLLGKIGEWRAAGREDVLLVGSEGLSKCAPEELVQLRDRISGGGRAIVLDHRSLPAFLSRSIVQSPKSGALANVTYPSVISAGLLDRDLKYWRTRDHDWISQWGALELPTSGLSRCYLEVSGDDNRAATATVLEVAEGAGSVLLCQMNLQAALGVEPAADRLMNNLLRWTGMPSTFAAPAAVSSTVIIANPGRRLGVLRERLGVEGTVVDTSKAVDPAMVSAAKLIVVDGAETPKVDEAAVRAALEGGGTLFVIEPGPETAAWIARVAGAEVGVEKFAQTRGQLTGFHSLTAGLNHGSLFIGPFNNIGGGLHMDTTIPMQATSDSLGHFVLKGSGVVPLMTPGFIGEVRVPKGRVVVTTIRTLDYPVAKPMFLMSALLGNSGARLSPGGIQSGPVQTANWAFHPVSLEKFMNWSLSDDPNGRRGFHMQGSDNDMHLFPRGKVNFHGVEYDLVDPEKLGGNGVVALGGKGYESRHPTSVKGIAVGRKADRLYFLHNTAWGVPGFVYRVYYTEDRKRWIPGQPDPFVDVVVKPDENIADWWGANSYESGEKFIGGATVAWSGATDYHKSRGVRVGVFQMVWDNPYPEKEIESVDIISPGKVGGGQIFVYAITAASRAEGGGKPSAMVPLRSLLPAEVKESEVFEQYENGRYGLVILKDGRVPVVYSREGRSLVSVTSPVAWMGRSNVVKAVTEPDSSRVFHLEGTVGKSGGWSAKIACRASLVRWDVEWRATGTEAKVPDIRVVVTPLSRPLNDIHRYGTNPMDVVTDNGSFSVQWQERIRQWYEAYWIRDNTFCFRPLWEL
jgi:hypothetical protein